MEETDEKFLKRADEHINLSNEQLEDSSPGWVSASMMYSVARFNSWLSAVEFTSAEEMEAAKAEMIQYFVGEYEKMLTENMDDYIRNFDRYMQ